MKPLHLLILAFFGVCQGDDTPKLPLVAISQIVEHDALTKEREGIIEALKDAGFEDGKTVTIVYENAQGNMATVTQIAVGFAGRKPDVAVGIATPSAQSLIQPMAKIGVPVVFAAVSDPLEAKLVSTLDKRPENVTGVSDGLALKPQLELIKKLLPNAKTIGVLYNPGETNSAKAVLLLKELAPKMGLSVVLATTSKTSETISAALSLVGKADAIFIPNDNTVMASIAGVVGMGRTHNLPVFTPDLDSAEQGILAVRSASHKTMGYKAGQMVAKILKGEKAGDLLVEVDHKMDLAINTTSAEKLGISIPDDLKKEAKFVS
ncbi:MAG: ABC transporter substrate-binding protein [Alphaproteobacteria bacterium]|jgi:putative ABC transport system substrate-binding protein|nr:ABC transporter substrate-binding protein [Alphaproteobacteria bacterium]